ncbi:50S ribosomal protein L5 [Candidatus Riesia pediculicola]|nr:50S ribosomal protein L5 [Candidatus Riesia pediculicola]ARC54493.1 50S ribosomal protein L5 [Candidatus Riesia pediculicola]QOJ86531.1 50S ribosomal protein L5 [Candidatus Riesia pediculicola]
MKDSMLELYKKEVIKKLTERFKYSSVMQVPKITKITLNIGFSSDIDKKTLDNSYRRLSFIAGQRPLLIKTKKSISGFKIRKGCIIGCKVTLRKKNMWNFLKKLICIAIPRIRDFRGFSKKSFDGTGNYNIGIKEQIIFPEIDYNKIEKSRGMDISITTNTDSDEVGIALLSAFQFPFRK